MDRGNKGGYASIGRQQYLGFSLKLQNQEESDRFSLSVQGKAQQGWQGQPIQGSPSCQGVCTNHWHRS